MRCRTAGAPRALGSRRVVAASLGLALVVPVLMLVTTSQASAAATTLYVAQGGSDTNNACATVAAPCATVSRALTQAAAGATIKVSGTIADHLDVPYTLSPLTITGAGSAAPAVLDGSGSGIVVSTDASLTLDSLTVRNGSNLTNGAGIVTTSTLNVQHSSITGNTANVGAGIYSWNGDVTVSDSTLAGNTAGVSGVLGGQGGAIYVGHGSVAVLRSTLSGNVATDGGAVYTYDDSPVTITESTVSGNTAGRGGGLMTQDLTLLRSTVTGNTANVGGTALWNSGRGVARLIDSTLVDNVANGTMRTIDNSGTVYLGASIVGPSIGPSAGSTCVAQTGGLFVSLGYNIDSGTSCSTTQSTDLNTTDPGLGALADNGGPTLTMRPSAGSPALDRIPLGTAFDGVTVCARQDQRGFPGPVAGATGCAIGAVEAAAWTTMSQPALTLTSTSGSFAVPLTLVTTGGAGYGAVTYAATNGTATGCAVGGSPVVLTATSVGTCKVTATKAGYGAYQPISSAATTVTIAKSAQAPLAVTATSAGGTSPAYGTAVALATTGGSGAGAVTYAVAAGTASGCAISASAPYLLTSTSVGTCLVTATKADDGNYLQAVSAQQTITYTKGSQSVVTVVPTSGTYGTPLTMAASGGSGTGTLSYAVADGTATGCAINGTGPFTLTSTSAGTCTVTATRAGDTNYLERSSVATTVTLAPASQKPLALTSYLASVGAPMLLTTSGGSGTGAVTYTVTSNPATTGCAITGTGPYYLTATGVGKCGVQATKAADASYKVVSAPLTYVTVAQGTQAVLTVTSTVGPAGSPITLATSGGSGTGAVSYTVVDGEAAGCAIEGEPAAVVATTAGTCVVTATKAADADYKVASSEPTTVTFTPLAQTVLAVTSIAGTAGTALVLTVAGGSGSGAVTYAVANGTAAGCTVSGTAPASLSATGAGTCIVTVTKAGDDLHAAASSAATTVTFVASGKPAASITAPSAVRSLRVKGKPTAARRVVSWLAPATSGGAAVTAYRIEVRKGSHLLLTKRSSGTRLVLRARKLRTGRLTVTVVAINAAGTGQAARVAFRMR